MRTGLQVVLILALTGSSAHSESTDAQRTRMEERQGPTAEVAKIQPIDLDDVHLADAFQTLQERSGINISPLWKSLDAVGVGPTTAVTAHLTGTAEEAVAGILAAVSPQRRLSYIRSGGTILVGSVDQLKRMSQRAAAQKDSSWDQLRPTLALRLPELKCDAVALAELIDFLGDAGGANLLVDWQGLSPHKIEQAKVSASCRDIEFSAALELVVDSCPQAEYGPCGNVIVISTPERLKQLAAAHRRHLDAVKADRNGKPRVLAELDLRGVAFGAAIEFLGESSGLAIETDWDVLAKAGVKKADPVSLKLRKIALADALDLLLFTACPTGELDWVMEDGKIVLERHPTPAAPPQKSADHEPAR